MYRRLAFGVLGVGLLFCLPQKVQATHIVGGEMGYTCLGDNRYEIRLTIYRDCFFGNPDAYFDDPASIGVFDVNNQLLQDIRVDLMADDTLSPVLTNECLVIPPDVCVHTTTYRTTVELLPRPGGYQLAYQRCCRNQTINNIIDPLATGATYGVVISERALEECNSSAEFLQWPPLYICADEPIFFDQSATDVDGDSIVYRLCTPLQGADPTNPRPQPPNPPPYQEVVWNDPPYNEDNMLNGFSGDPVLAIDPVTGLLTGTPNTVGQFVVGICAEEYRNGELISTTRRDFQYNVGVCGVITSAFFAPEVQCDGLEVSIVNQSEGTENFAWLFGDPAAPLGMSVEVNPSFTFPDFGTYPITLIAAPGSACADTFQQNIALYPLSLQPAFSLDTLVCGDSLVLQLNDLSTDTLSEITSWQWTLNGEVISEEPVPPPVVLTESGVANLGLTLTAENGCENRTFTLLEEVTFIQIDLPADTLLVCPGEPTELNPDFNPDYTYLWSPAVGLDSSTSGNPTAMPAATTTYTVTVRDPATDCVSERSITVELSPPLTVELTPDTVTCAEQTLLTANSPTAVRYIWSDLADFTSLLSDTSLVTVAPLGAQTYYLQLTDAAGCVRVDSVLVNSIAVNTQLAADTALCLGESLQLSVENLDPNDDLNYQWYNNEGIIVGAIAAELTITPMEVGNEWYSVFLGNQASCTRVDSILVSTIDTTDLATTVSWQQCSNGRVDFSSTSSFASVLQWNFGDPNVPDAQAIGAMVSHVYDTPGFYNVTVSLPDYLPCTTSFTVPVEVSELGSVQPDFSWAYTSCDSVAVILFTDE
ncbi:MAG: PKD domain-containing protein, partial [Bacteroidota bacterium]